MRRGDAFLRRGQSSRLSNSSTDPNERLVSAAAVARILGVDRRTVERWAATGLFRRHSVGKQWRYSVQEVKEGVRNRTKASLRAGRPDNTRASEHIIRFGAFELSDEVLRLGAVCSERSLGAACPSSGPGGHHER